jgi:ABC-type phosphate/phosphonate transport system permease subunit
MHNNTRDMIKTASIFVAARVAIVAVVLFGPQIVTWFALVSPLVFDIVRAIPERILDLLTWLF